MNTTAKTPHPIQPDLVRRACGGWLALSPKGASLKIGVQAETAEEATEKFRSAFDRSMQILSTVEARVGQAEKQAAE